MNWTCLWEADGAHQEETRIRIGTQPRGRPSGEGEGVRGLQILCGLSIIIVIILIFRVPLPLLSFVRRRVFICREDEETRERDTVTDRHSRRLISWWCKRTGLLTIVFFILFKIIFLTVHVSVHLSVLHRETMLEVPGGSELIPGDLVHRLRLLARQQTHLFITVIIIVVILCHDIFLILLFLKVVWLSLWTSDEMETVINKTLLV